MSNVEPSISHVIGTNIRTLRRAKDLSAPTLAARCGIGHQVLYEYEAGKVRIAASVLYSISVALDCDIHVLFRNLARDAGVAGFKDAETEEGADALDSIAITEIRDQIKKLTESIKLHGL